MARRGEEGEVEVLRTSGKCKKGKSGGEARVLV